MKVVISQCKYCHNNNQILTDYPILQKYADKGHYVDYKENQVAVYELLRIDNAN